MDAKYDACGYVAGNEMVTLIATDVQGSTELWEWNNKAMMEAINLHDRIMRSQMTKFGGYETATEGDAFVVAFRNPGNAVAWAAAMQQVPIILAVAVLLCCSKRCITCTTTVALAAAIQRVPVILAVAVLLCCSKRFTCSNSVIAVAWAAAV